MKKEFALMAIVTLIILSGCNPSSEDAEKSSSPYAGGTNGLLFQWTSPTLENNVLFDQGQSSLPLILSIKNDGEYTIGSDDTISIVLDGVHYSDVEYTDIEDDLTKTINEEILGRTKNSDGTIREGLSTYVEFDEFKYLRKVNGDTVRPIRAKVCYPYKTYATAKICMTENLAVPPKDALCDVSGEGEVFSSSAPIQVTSFSQQVLSSTAIELVFKIEHKSSGELFLGEGNNNKCESIFGNRDLVKVTIGDYSDSFWDGLTCVNNPNQINVNPQEFNVRLNRGEANVRCTLKLDQNDLKNYYKELPIELSYWYQDDASTSLLIRPSGEE